MESSAAVSSLLCRAILLLEISALWAEEIDKMHVIDVPPGLARVEMGCIFWVRWRQITIIKQSGTARRQHSARSVGGHRNCYGSHGTQLARKGFPNVEYGQEYRVIISSSTRSYEETLLRAYVPLSGKPIRVFFGGSTMQECADETELKTTLKEYLQAEAVRTRIQQLSNLGS